MSLTRTFRTADTDRARIGTVTGLQVPRPRFLSVRRIKRGVGTISAQVSTWKNLKFTFRNESKS